MIILSLMFLFVIFVVMLVAGICSQALPKEEKQLLEKWQCNYLPVGVCSLLFASVFLVCMYKNPVSFTYVICVAAFLC